MKKLIAILIASAMACAFVPMVGAVDPTIEVTLNPNATVSITVNQSVWAPVCAVGGGTNSTADDWAILTNTGDVNVSVTIDAENSEDWAIAGSAGHNAFKLETLGIAKTLEASPIAFVTNLPTDAGDNTQTFGLKITMPTTSSTSDAQHITITFTASAIS